MPIIMDSLVAEVAVVVTAVVAEAEATLTSVPA